MSLNTPQKTIKCPFCGNELEDGYVMAPYHIVWTKVKRSFMPPAGIYRKGERVIAPFSLFLAHQEALACESCGSIITISAPATKSDRP